MSETDLTQLVVGADGGIGAAYVSACRSAQTVASVTPSLFLTSRRPIANTAPEVQWQQLDYEIAESTEQLAEYMQQQVDALDRLIITTGVLHSKSFVPEKSLNQLNSMSMKSLFAVNAAGPLALIAALEPLLKRSQAPKIVVLSAQVGSIEDNHLGGWYSYRMSKAALNMGLKTASIEMARWKNSPTIVAVHPGTTHSQLSKPFVKRRKAPVQTAETAGARLQALVERLQKDQSGQFLTLGGDILPW